MQQRIYREFVEYGEKFFNKPVTETITAAVIPCRNLDNVVFCFRPSENLPIHSFVRDRRRFFSFSKGKEDVGFKWCSAKRDSTRVSSAFDNGGSSNSITRRTKS